MAPPNRSLPEKILRGLAKRPVLFVSAASLSFRVGKDALRVKKGEIDLRELRARAGTHFGSISGGVAGAAAGAAALSVIPGIGTILGGMAGGMIGEKAGAKFGRRAIEAIEQAVTGAAPRERGSGGGAGFDPPKRSL